MPLAAGSHCCGWERLLAGSKPASASAASSASPAAPAGKEEHLFASPLAQLFQEKFGPALQRGTAGESWQEEGSWGQQEDAASASLAQQGMASAHSVQIMASNLTNEHLLGTPLATSWPLCSRDTSTSSRVSAEGWRMQPQ